MVRLTTKGHIVGAGRWPQINIAGRPQQMPSLPHGVSVVCGIDDGSGEHMIICETLKEMQELYDHAKCLLEQHLVITISWYHTPNLTDMTAIA